MKSLFPYAGSSAKYAGMIAEMIRREEWKSYAEPMVGSGAVYFELCPARGDTYINDINFLTMNLYKTVRDNPAGLIEWLSMLPANREIFDAILAVATDPDEDVILAARWYYLLWLCYNGVVKARDGKPYLTFGDRYKTWEQRFRYREQHINIASIILTRTEICTGDYRDVPYADIAYFDPPWWGSAEDYGVSFDHKLFAEFLTYYPGRWIVSINNRKETQELYLPISTWSAELSPFYSVAPVMQGRKKHKELIVTNFIPRMYS